MPTPDMHGDTILIVEDEFAIASELATEFRRRGAEVVGPAPTVDHALALLDATERLDAAVLDFNLRGELGHRIADALQRRRVPFVFATGYGDLLGVDDYGGMARLEKPVAPELVAQMLSDRLHGNWLLAALPDAELARLRPALKLLSLDRDDVLIKAGEPIESLYFPIRGIASVIAPSAAGDSVEVGIVGAEGFVGAPLVLGQSTSPLSVVCQLSGTAYRMRASALCEAMASDAFRAVLLRYLDAFLLQVSGTAVANARCTLEQRLARWLLMVHDRQPSDSFALTHEYLSIMLGVRRAGVTVALHVLARAGAIEIQRGRITVASRAKLEGLCGDGYGPFEAAYKRLRPESLQSAEGVAGLGPVDASRARRI